MTVLYAISVISFCALVWAAYAITRHIRIASSADRLASGTSPRHTVNPESKPRKAS